MSRSGALGDILRAHPPLRWSGAPDVAWSAGSIGRAERDPARTATSGAMSGSVHHGGMVRAFLSTVVHPAVLDRVLDAGRRAPAAGNTAEGRAFVVLDDPDLYWDVALPAGPRRDSFAWPGLLAAPVLVVVCVRPGAWAERYAEDDKRRAATLGSSPDAWPQPFWWVDAGLSIEAILLAAKAEGLGASLFGLFEREAEVLAALGVPDGWRGVAVVALGHPDPAGGPRPGRSAARPRPPLDEVVHRNGW